MKRICRNCFFVFLIILLCLPAPAVFAEIPYKTYTEDHNRKFVRTQDAYTPVGTIVKLGSVEFKEPSDLSVDPEDALYVADTGNHRIVVIARDGTLKKILGTDVLKQPTGTFVDDQGYIYVADSGNRKVYKFDGDGKLLQTFSRPESPLFGKETPFKPMKVTVDKRGNVYIVSEGTTNGVIQLSPYGEFMGFFGSNESQVNLKIVLERLFFTKEQRLKLFQNIPPSPTNIAIDAKGLIYTVTQGEEGRSIKRLNISGINQLPTDMNDDPLFTDLFVGPGGNIFAVTQKGFIHEYDSEGHLIFRFGGTDDGKMRVGLFVNPSGIAADSMGNLYVLDKERNNIQIFAPTEFAEEVHRALTLYKEGFYIKSQEPWNKVLQMNNLFDLAHKGLGDAYYKRQMYTEALAEYEIANDKKGYSDAFWEIRNQWLRNHLTDVFLWAAGLFVFLKLLKRIHRRTGIFRRIILWKNEMVRIKLVSDILFLFRFIKHPIDGFYGIKEENKGSVLSAGILYVVYFIEHLFSLYFTGFIFMNFEITDLMLSREIIIVFAPFALWVVSNYLVSTISSGEGKFSEICKATIYAFVPYLVFGPFVVILSHALTYNESFILEFSNLILMAWTGVLLFLMVKEIHNYTIRETLLNILITLFAMLILLLVIFIVYVLLEQVRDFVDSVIQELIVRANR